jgi:hypothetical protein
LVVERVEEAEPLWEQKEAVVVDGSLVDCEATEEIDHR